MPLLSCPPAGKIRLVISAATSSLASLRKSLARRRLAKASAATSSKVLARRRLAKGYSGEAGNFWDWGIIWGLILVDFLHLIDDLEGKSSKIKRRANPETFKNSMPKVRKKHIIQKKPPCFAAAKIKMGFLLEIGSGKDGMAHYSLLFFN